MGRERKGEREVEERRGSNRGVRNKGEERKGGRERGSECESLRHVKARSSSSSRSFHAL
jgi:hypothetical protein